MDKEIKFVVSPDVFPVKFLFWIGPYNHKRANKFCFKHFTQDYGEELDPPEMEGACWHDAGGSLIYCERPPYTTADIGLLSHEITHAVLNAGQNLGFKPSPSSEEFYCYMNQYLLTRCLEEFQTRFKKRNNEEEQ